MKNNKPTPATKTSGGTTTTTAKKGRSSLGTLTGTVAVMTLLFSACKHDDLKPTAATGTVKTTMTQEEGKKLEARILSFYGEMKALKGMSIHAKGAEDKMPVDSVELLTEASYNYYVARNSDELVKNISFELKEPMDNGEVDMSKVSEAFYRIKDSLMKMYDDIAYTDKKLSAFDLDVSADGSDAKFTVRAGITEGPTPTGNYTFAQSGKKYFSGPANKVWYAFMFPPATGGVAIPGTTPTYYTSYINGVGLADFNTGQLVSQDNTQPGAWGAMRSLAIYNIFGLSLTPQLYINIHAKGINTNYLGNVPYIQSQGAITLPSPYSTFPDFWASETYTTQIYVNASGPGFSDPNATLKQWLSVDLMNQYLTHAPALVAAAVPAGKVGFDFNVISTAAFGTQTNQVTGQQYADRSVGYIVSYGDPTSIVLSGGYTVGLPSF